jgi:HAMP domain-containing protein
MPESTAPNAPADADRLEAAAERFERMTQS